MQLEWFTAPLIGGAIGLITNSLAIRMLFRPHRALYIGRFHVPFTPGLIPKEKERIASSIGEVISKYLLDDATIQKALCDEKIRNRVREYVHKWILHMQGVTTTVEEFLEQRGWIDSVNICESKIRESVSSYLINACIENDMIDEIVTVALNEILQSMNSVVAKIAKAPLESAKPQIINEIKKMVEERGPEMIGSYIDQKYVEITDLRICDLAKLAEEKEKTVLDFVQEKYIDFMEHKSIELIRSLNLQRIVEERIKEYDIAQLENILLAICKKELNALVWLGGLLGLIMGYVNLLF